MHPGLQAGAELPLPIRRARQEDAQAVALITDSAYAKYVPLLGRKPQPMTADHQKMISENAVWLLFREDYPVGVLVLVNEPDCLLIYSVAIRPELQKHGLGRRLLDWAEQEARRLGRQHIRLYTNALMAANIALYRRLGYIETHREPFGDSTLVHMSKHLEEDVGQP
jgi:ribosomal protein S18 acetylase RimI-like enzyme